MWSSKMAARWRGEDGDLNAGNRDFLASNGPNEFVLSRLDVEGSQMDTQSCVDHSILAIFEDSTAASEDKGGAEEESETLLSALTEMLDSVEDDNGTLSPFDTLPDTQLLAQREGRDNSADLPLADRLRPRCKSPSVTFAIKIDGEQGGESQTERNSPSQLFKPQRQTLFHSKSKKAEAEVDVFTSTSLVNLVKLMHPYCLKLHVEDKGDKLRRDHTLFSQGEVWKYERPSEESDEEINVVSDDEVTVKETKEENKGDNGKLLKSALLNGNSRAPPAREKKRVSFGPVQVASFDTSVEKGVNDKNVTSGHASETASAPLINTKALENPAGSALEAQTAPSSEANSKAEVLPPKGDTKAKSLSLQQYRQLRQKRQPLVEKQGNNTTKWPSVPEPPKELTPILCLQRQRPQTLHRSLGFKTHRTSAPPRPHPSEAKPSSHLLRSGSKRPRTATRIIPPAGPHYSNIIAPESKKSPVKKPTLLSSDPPNPVLLPLPVSQTPPPSTDRDSSEVNVEFLNRDPNPDSTRHFHHIQNESSGTSLQRQPPSSGPKPEVVSAGQDCTTLFQEIQNKLPEIASGVTSRPPALCPGTTHIQPSAADTQPQPPKGSPSPAKEAKPEPKTPPSPRQPPAPVDAPALLKETVAEAPPGEPPPPALHFGCGVQSAAAGSGIEAPDLTSLLEQFEETQAKEERVEPQLVTSPSSLQTDEQGTQPVRTPSSTSESAGTPSKTPRNPPHVRASAGVDIPEPLGTEVIVSTQRDLPARRRNPPSKAIQIIDPRPLPSKKTLSNLSELPAAHICSSVSSDHDYCGPVDRPLTYAAQRSRASKPKDISSSTDEPPVIDHDSSAAADGGCGANTTIRAVDNANTNNEKPVMQHLSEELETDRVLLLSDSAAAEQHHGCAAEDKTAPCTLPTPPPSPPGRGRERGRYRRRSPLSDSSCSSRSSSSSSSSSSSASRSPKRQKRRHRRSESSSSSSSPSSSPPRRYRWSYSRSRRSRSRSRSWSQSRSPSRSRSPSPQICRGQWRDVYRRRESRKLRREHEIRLQKLKAIDERRVVYVGRICRSMTHDELRQRFSQFGEVECVSLHFRDRGDHYGFVTFYNMEDAFAAIDNSGKLRRPDELPFDICFGGRRQFCNSDYADLDANRDVDPSPAKSRFKDLDFDSLLKQAQRGLKR